MTQPKALYLADILEDAGKPADVAEAAAAELRRLHAENERCKTVCAATAEGWRQDTALAEPVQEPVAWMVDGSLYASKEVAQKMGGNAYTLRALYTAPPQRKPLTEEEIDHCWYESGGLSLKFARAIERAHGIGEP